MTLEEAKKYAVERLAEVSVPIEEMAFLKYLDSLDGPRVSLFILLHALQVLQDEGVIRSFKEGGKRYYALA